MEFRCRSNQLESWTWKYDQFVSEKNAVTAKFFALRGRLYDQRDRVLSSSVYFLQLKGQTDTLVEWTTVLWFQVKLGIIKERNQVQAIRVDELTIQLRRMCCEKEALNGIVDQLIEENVNFDQLVRWLRTRHVHYLIQNARTVSRRQTFQIEMSQT